MTDMTTDEMLRRHITEENVRFAASIMRRVAMDPHKIQWVPSMPREVRESLLALGLQVRFDDEWGVSL